MLKLSTFLPALAAVAVVVGLSGCPAEQESSPPAQTQPEPDADHDAHAGHDHDAGEFAEALAELSDDDRAAAEKQKICPVSGDPLGSMGKPYKVTVKDREVFLCCPGCEDAIKGDPEKYLAKLDE